MLRFAKIVENRFRQKFQYALSAAKAKILIKINAARLEINGGIFFLIMGL